MRCFLKHLNPFVINPSLIKAQTELIRAFPEELQLIQNLSVELSDSYLEQDMPILLDILYHFKGQIKTVKVNVPTSVQHLLSEFIKDLTNLELAQISNCDMNLLLNFAQGQGVNLKLTELHLEADLQYENITLEYVYQYLPNVKVKL